MGDAARFKRSRITGGQVYSALSPPAQQDRDFPGLNVPATLVQQPADEGRNRIRQACVDGLLCQARFVWRRNRENDDAWSGFRILTVVFERGPIGLAALNIASHFCFKRGVHTLLDVANRTE